MNSSELKQSVLAMMYGDGYVDYNEVSGKARLDIYHCEAQYELLKEKQRILESLKISCRITEKIDNRLLASGGVRKGYRLQTNFTHYVGKLHRAPKITVLRQLIKPKALAILWMDDGTLIYNNKGNYSTATLCTDSWSWDEVKKFRDLWNKEYGWCPELMEYTCRGKVYPRLRMRKKEMQKLSTIIKSYVLEDMNYKIIDS